MRHKQRPVKSSRHKSVTFIIDSSQTSFIDNNNRNHQQQQEQLQQLQAQQDEQFQLYDDYHETIDNESHHNNHHRHHHHHHHHNNNNNNNSNHQHHRQNNSNNVNPSYDNKYQSSTSDVESPFMRKQFEHNVRHMSDIMRLAFLENNDISPETWTDIDFNSMSTASILQRNIQHQLQQQRREQQLQSRQKQHQQQLQQQQQRHHHQHHQQQQSRHWQTQKSQQNQPQQRQQTYLEQQQQFQQEEDYQTFSDIDIFATAMPTTSSSSRQNNNHRDMTSAPRATSSNYIENNQRKPIRVREAPSRLSGAQQDVSSHSMMDSDVSVVNHGNGFLCDDPECGKVFSSLRKLRHHKVVHSDEFPFVCEFQGCGKKFKRKFGIDLHSTTHFDLDPDMYTKTSNNSSLPFFGRRMQYSMCKPCNQKFKTVHEYQYHMLKHGKEPFKCPVKGCGQTFSIWKSFQKHRASHYFNYYCKMDSSCDHHTSNLQLLKLHIYCCHFRRVLPANATLSSKDRVQEEDDSKMDVGVDAVDNDDSELYLDVEGDAQHEVSEQSIEETTPVKLEQSSMSPENEPQSQPQPEPVTPRRDSRLRKNPPRSSTFCHQDYASVNNGKGLSKSTTSTPTSVKKIHAAASSTSGSSQSSPEKKPKLPLKILPKRSAQRLPMSILAADDASTEDDDEQDNGDSYQEDSLNHSRDVDSGREDNHQDLTNGSRLSNYIENNPRKPIRVREAPSRSSGGQHNVSCHSMMDSDVSVINHGNGFLCDEPGCGKSFASVRKLRHHKVVHSDEFPFVCQFKGCGKRFKRKFGIDLHSTTHFDLDPDMYNKTSNNSSLPFFGRRMQYSMCKPCNQKFKTVHEYQYHMLKHGKEPFKCPVKGCGQTFSIWKSFQKHRASHYFNYYCKMDSSCDHHTSNLQLLKLHIYCCHFRRVLPANATLSSKDRVQEEDDSKMDVGVDAVDNDDSELYLDVEGDPQHEPSEQSMESTPVKLEPSLTVPEAEAEPVTPRRDSRLRKNPPRSSTFCHQDYASVNNGKGLGKSTTSTPTSVKRIHAATSSTGGSQSSPEKKPKLPLKILPKRSAQRLPMSLLAADDASTEDDDEQSHGQSDEEGSLGRGRDVDNGGNGTGDDNHEDPTGASRFRCHLCDFKFNVRFQLTKHLSTHLELTSDMYLATADMKVIKLSERRRREFFCDKCNLKFEQMSELDVHMRKHGQRPYVCNFCPQRSTFRLAKQYLSHLYEHRFIYKCLMDPKCEFTINRKDALKLHVFRMHLDQKLPSYLENYATIFNENEF